jgi:hypothetical protein
VMECTQARQLVPVMLGTIRGVVERREGQSGGPMSVPTGRGTSDDR